MLFTKDASKTIKQRKTENEGIKKSPWKYYVKDKWYNILISEK